jgi:holo-[acyl-carrier protein] synthase
MSQIIGIGVDLVEVDRIEQIIVRWGNRFLWRVFTANEIAYCEAKAHPAQHFAARFAAKEAVMKALGTGWNERVGFQSIEIIRTGKNAPVAELRAEALGCLPHGSTVLLSLSHTAAYATAFALVTSRDSATFTSHFPGETS